jgi:hypothetical protein
VFDTKPPEEIKLLAYDYVVITNENNILDILRTLLAHGVPANKILFGGNFNQAV